MRYCLMILCLIYLLPVHAAESQKKDSFSELTEMTEQDRTKLNQTVKDYQPPKNP